MVRVISKTLILDAYSLSSPEFHISTTVGFVSLTYQPGAGMSYQYGARTGGIFRCRVNSRLYIDVESERMVYQM
jgi:hypothetical protein